MRWFRARRRNDAAERSSGDEVLSAQEFETEMEKKAVTLLGMNLGEFRARASVGELPDTPAVDHLRFLLGV